VDIPSFEGAGGGVLCAGGFNSTGGGSASTTV